MRDGTGKKCPRNHGMVRLAWDTASFQFRTPCGSNGTQTAPNWANERQMQMKTDSTRQKGSQHVAIVDPFRGRGPGTPSVLVPERSGIISGYFGPFFACFGFGPGRPRLNTTHLVSRRPNADRRRAIWGEGGPPASLCRVPRPSQGAMEPQQGVSFSEFLVLAALELLAACLRVAQCASPPEWPKVAINQLKDYVLQLGDLLHPNGVSRLVPQPPSPRYPHRSPTCALPGRATPEIPRRGTLGLHA